MNIRKSSRSGFTIGELLIVIVIIGILACALHPLVKKMTRDKRGEQFKAYFNCEFPKNSAWRNAVRPVVMERVRFAQQEVAEQRKKLATEREEAEKLPYDGNANLGRRATAFYGCESTEAHLKEFELLFYKVVMTAKSAGFQDKELEPYGWIPEYYQAQYGQ